MKRALLVLLLAAAVTTLWPGVHAPPPAHAEADYYTCPMHPTVVSEEPGTCPVCGMDLVPKTQGAKPEHSAGGVSIDPVVVQNMGIRVAHVKRGSVYRHVRTLGEVDVAEDAVSVVNLRFSGWIERIWADQTGQAVKKGQWLFRIYSPEVIAAQEELVLAAGSSGRESKLARAARRRLELWQIPNSHIDKVLADGDGQRTLVVSAPRSGYVLHKAVVQGARVQAGQDLYRIGDLEKIWVNAEVYEFDAPWIRVAQRASMELSFQAGQTWAGSVAYIYPTLNPRSRTLRVRLEFENPGLRLKPGMFATVRIEAQRKDEVLTIPPEAVLPSGERRLVFVSPTLGRYEPREVVTGLRGDNGALEVLSGLALDEVVVVSGQFLLDSESQLQEAVRKLLPDDLQVPADAPHYRCPLHPQIEEPEPGECPICGTELEAAP